MMQKPNKETLIKLGALAAAFAIAAVGISIQESSFPASAGAEYLEKQGYTHVSGGDVQPSLGCGRSSIGRHYTATNEEGKIVKRTVCNSLFGPRDPAYQ